MQPAPSRQNEILASNLLFVGVALSFGLLLVRTFVVHSARMPEKPQQWVNFFIGPLLYVAVAYAIRRGHQWAKSLLAVAAVLVLVSIASSFNATLRSLRQDVLLAVGYVSELVLQLVALWILFRKPKPALDEARRLGVE